jgi:glucose-1-phosphate thymidylyltransferase
LTRDSPKHLLKVGGKPVLEHVLAKIFPLEDVDEIFIVTNSRFFGHFEEWLEDFAKNIPQGKRIEIIDDGTTSNETRLGGLGDLLFVIREKAIEDDVIVVSADNLFTFNLGSFTENCKAAGVSGIGIYDVENLDEAKKLGVVSVNEHDLLTGFEEKPEHPKSTLASTGIYFYPRSILGLFEEYAAESDKLDGPGFFVKWLYKRYPVKGIKLPGKWFDIGSFEMLEQANNEFGK